MGFNNFYPYTDFNELNLDWILRTIKELTKSLTDFEAFNKITWQGDWNIGNYYPQWSLVNDLEGNGYIAVKPVPRNVPIDNTDYWKKVANYDALYSEFEQRIETLEDDYQGLISQFNDLSSDVGNLDNLNTRDKTSIVNSINSVVEDINALPKYVFFSDSYGLTNWGVAPYTSYFSQRVLPHGDDGLYSFAESGAAFCRVGVNYDVEGLITAHLNDIPNKDEITDVVLSFGINDRVQDISNLFSKMSAVNTLIKTNFPKATIWLAWLGNQLQKSDSEYVGYLNCIRLYEEDAVTLGWKWCEGVQYICHDRRNINTAHDNIHPSDVGSQRLAFGLAQILRGNSYKYYARLRTNMTLVEGDTTVIVDQTIDGNITNTWISDGSLNDDTNAYMGTSGGRKIGTINNSIIDYHMSQKHIVPSFAYGISKNYFNSMEYIKNNAEVYHNIYCGGMAVEVITSYYWNNHELTVPTIMF